MSVPFNALALQDAPIQAELVKYQKMPNSGSTGKCLTASRCLCWVASLLARPRALHYGHFATRHGARMSVLLEKQRNGVATVTIDRQPVLNALDVPANASTIRATVDGHLNSLHLCLRDASIGRARPRDDRRRPLP